MNLVPVRYTEDWEKRWDRFVLGDSVNGTFLQSRRFLNYHPKDRFEDASVLFLQGDNIVAVVPACTGVEEGRNCFFSHRGSTFGGIIISKNKYNITTLDQLFPVFDEYVSTQGYECAYIKNTSDVFSSNSQDLIDYYFYKHGYCAINELSFYIDCEALGDDITASWSSGRRRDLRYSMKNGLSFRKLESDEELHRFYTILGDNLARHGTYPVHTVEELKDFRDNRLRDEVDFYGVFLDDRFLAGSMLFYFGKQVLHTQYLAQDAEFSSLFTMNFLNYNLIKLAKDNGFRRFSFGVSTEERGKVLNTGLAVFKEGFGTQFCNNRSYKKIFRNN